MAQLQEMDAFRIMIDAILPFVIEFAHFIFFLI